MNPSFLTFNCVRVEQETSCCLTRLVPFGSSSCSRSGYWNVIVYGRKHSYRLYCKLLNEATRWANSIQNVIDTKAPIDTPTQQLVQDIKVRHVSLKLVETHQELKD